jgi:tetratricopeptide (TPR) repeat protein
MPTLLKFAGAPPSPDSDGASLDPYLVGKKDAGRPAFGETDYPLSFGWAPLQSVRSQGFKFIEAPRPELYDLQLDAAESSNTYDPRDARVQQSRAMLAELRTTESPVERSNEGVRPGSSHELNNKSVPARSGGATVGLDPSTMPDPKDKIEEQNLLHAAMIASEDNRFADARKALEKVLMLDPQSATSMRQLGEMELQAGDYVQAVAHLKGALRIRPDDALASFYAGQALEKTRDVAGARDALETSLKLMPGQFPARLLLGRVYLGLKDPVAAEDQFEAALLLQSDSVEAKLGKAEAQMARGNFAEAVQALEALSRIHPKNAEVFELMAKAYSGLGKKTEAQRAEARAKLLYGKK